MGYIVVRQLRLQLPNTHGGKRRGAGRPTSRKRPSEKHQVRADITCKTPVHVVMRALPDVPRLRTREAYAAIREATAQVMIAHPAFRIVHMSIQHNHVHAIVEADDKAALSRGMQVFQSVAARRINKAFRRRGKGVFADRFHAVVLTSPRQVRNTLAYVLNNWRHHREDRGKRWRLDPYSTAWQFAGWKERVGEAGTFPTPTAYRPLYVWLPRSWLLRVGWRDRYPAIGLHEIPGGTE